MKTVGEKRPRYTVSIDEYVRFRRDGYLIVRGLVSKEDTERLLTWTEDIYEGRINLDHLSPVFNWMTDRLRDGWLPRAFTIRTIATRRRSGACCTPAFSTCWKP